MVGKANFTPEEWTLLLESPMMVAMAITAAEPSGVVGLLRESFATGSALVKASRDTHANELVKAVAAEFQTAAGRSSAREGMRAGLAGDHGGDVKARTLLLLAQVNDLLSAKAPEDAPAFKAWLNGIAQGVAEAARENGLLGFGGTKVSDAERATLAEIRTALSI